MRRLSPELGFEFIQYFQKCLTLRTRAKPTDKTHPNGMVFFGKPIESDYFHQDSEATKKVIEQAGLSAEESANWLSRIKQEGKIEIRSRHVQEGQAYVYTPAVRRSRKSVLAQLVHTFFAGSVEQTVK